MRHNRNLDQLLASLRNRKRSPLGWPGLSLSLILAISVHHRDPIGRYLARKLEGAKLTSAHVSRGLCHLSIDHLSRLAKMSDPAKITKFLKTFFNVLNAKGNSNKILSMPLKEYDIYNPDHLRDLRMGK